MPPVMPQGPACLRAVPAVLILVLTLGCKDGTGPKFGAPSALEIAGGDAQSGDVATELPLPLTIRVTDAEGRPVPRVPISFRVVSGGGSVATSATTDSAGRAAARWRLGTSTADSQRVEVTLTGAAAIPAVIFRASALAGRPATLSKVSGDGQEGEVAQRLPQMLVAAVKDAYGNPVPRAVVRWTAEASSIAPQSDTTDAAGLSRASWSLGTAAVEYAARAAVDTLAAVSFVARGTPGPATTLIVDPAVVDFSALGDTVRVHVQGRDRYGNEITRLRSWRSSDGAVVGVDTAGLVRSVGNGSAAVVIASGTAADTVRVIVQQVPVRVTVAPAADTLNAIGDTVVLKGRVLDRNGHEIVGAALSWSSSDDGVATTGPGGTVVSASVGRTVVRGSTGDLFGSADILVRQVMASLRLNSPAAGLLEGDTLRITAEGADSNGVAMPVTGVTWSSSRPDVALVANGLVSGVRFGETDVTASAGAASARRTVYVVAPSGRIGGGYYHTCALDGAGRAWCWGLSDVGQVGNGTIGLASNPTPQAVSGGRTYTSIAVSERFACALTGAGEVYCWGRNWEGQVGDGTYKDRAEPTRVQGGITFKSITVGERHACALDAAGHAYCWGEGLFGALGNGSTAPLSTPTQVLGGLTFRSLASGSYHVCGIATDGQTYCWGDPSWGATGRGLGRSVQPVPMPIVTAERFVQLASGYMLTGGLTGSGSVYCWGGFWYPFGTMPPPMPVPTLHPGRFVAVSVGYSHVCGYTPEMKLHCWGANRSGELGLGTNTDSGDEGDVRSGKTFVSAGTGQAHTCAITSGGEAYCWGGATFGRLGDGMETPRNAPTLPVAAITPFR